MQGIHPFQKLCPGPHTEMGPFLHQFPAGDLLDHSISDFWSNIPNLPAVWWMLVVILDEPLNGVVHVHRPASHEICYLGVGLSWVSKVLKATKPESDHSMLVPDGEVSVPAITVLLRLGYRLQLVATCKPMLPELKRQGIVTLLYLIRLNEITFVVAAPLPLVEQLDHFRFFKLHSCRGLGNPKSPNQTEIELELYKYQMSNFDKNTKSQFGKKFMISSNQNTNSVGGARAPPKQQVKKLGSPGKEFKPKLQKVSNLDVVNPLGVQNDLKKSITNFQQNKSKPGKEELLLPKIVKVPIPDTMQKEDKDALRRSPLLKKLYAKNMKLSASVDFSSNLSEQEHSDDSCKITEVKEMKEKTELIKPQPIPNLPQINLKQQYTYEQVDLISPNVQPKGVAISEKPKPQDDMQYDEHSYNEYDNESSSSGMAVSEEGQDSDDKQDDVDLSQRQREDSDENQKDESQPEAKDETLKKEQKKGPAKRKAPKRKGKIELLSMLTQRGMKQHYMQKSNAAILKNNAHLIYLQRFKKLPVIKPAAQVGQMKQEDHDELSLDEIIRDYEAQHGTPSTEELNKPPQQLGHQKETVTTEGVIHPAFAAHIVYIAVCAVKLAFARPSIGKYISTLTFICTLEVTVLDIVLTGGLIPPMPHDPTLTFFAKHLDAIEIIWLRARAQKLIRLCRDIQITADRALEKEKVPLLYDEATNRRNSMIQCWIAWDGHLTMLYLSLFPDKPQDLRNEIGQELQRFHDESLESMVKESFREDLEVHFKVMMDKKDWCRNDMKEFYLGEHLFVQSYLDGITEKMRDMESTFYSQEEVNRSKPIKIGLHTMPQSITIFCSELIESINEFWQVQLPPVAQVYCSKYNTSSGNPGLTFDYFYGPSNEQLHGVTSLEMYKRLQETNRKFWIRGHSADRMDKTICLRNRGFILDNVLFALMEPGQVGFPVSKLLAGTRKQMGYKTGEGPKTYSGLEQKAQMDFTLLSDSGKNPPMNEILTQRWKDNAIRLSKIADATAKHDVSPGTISQFDLRSQPFNPTRLTNKPKGKEKNPDITIL